VWPKQKVNEKQQTTNNARWPSWSKQSASFMHKASSSSDV